jgi:hypothetical protein
VGLIRTVLALLILVILFHVGMVYVGVGEDTNGLTAALYSLGQLVESPAQLVLEFLPFTQEQLGVADTNTFYVVALGAAALYFILYLLLGIGSRD